ncbi:hypothetical protein DFH09DRAFT_1074326 [Mycena vulgaris]|nr:hypothetical protein DFH09DRAFT_1074326 [Mycena vulgaris]
MSLQSQEDADMAKCFKFHGGEEEMLSLWPLEDEPLLWFDNSKEGSKPDWNNNPPKFSLLWCQNSVTPIQIPGPHISTNLFGRTVAEVFADFPTDFCDTPSPSSSPSLSPASPLFSPSPTDDEMGQLAPHDFSDPSVDEVSQQFSERIRLDSPYSSPPLAISESLHILHDNTPPPPLSPSTCNPLSINSLSDTFASSSVNSLSDTFSSSSSTLSVGTSSNAPSTYAVSPSPKPSSTGSSRSSPAPGLRRSPRRSSPTYITEVPELGEPYSGNTGDPYSTRDLVPALNLIVLEEYPLDTARRRISVKRTEHDEDFETLMDDADSRPRKKIVTRAASKRHSCTVPGCTESFTRPGDVLRHIKNAAIHKGSAQQVEALAANPIFCKLCGEELSRADAARRHELKGSCGKRTIRRKSTYSMLPA